jgi:glycerophosphoryl diester phosphodiesterase
VRPLLSSFSADALDAAREAVPEMPRAWLVEDLPDGWRTEIVRLGCIALNPRHTLLTQELVRDVRGAGLRVAAWTVNDPARAATLAGWGVDTIFTDAIDTIAADALSG